MSVINTMLHNLDERRAGAVRHASLLDEVSIPVHHKRPVRHILVIAPLTVCALAVATLYLWPRAEANADVVAVSRQAVLAAPKAVVLAPATPEIVPPQAAAHEPVSVVEQPTRSASDNMLLLATSMADIEKTPDRSGKPVSRPEPKENIAGRSATRAPVAVPEPSAPPANAQLRPAPAVVVDSGAIRVEQSVQTPAERNLMEVQHAADLQRRGSVVEAEASLRAVLANDGSMIAARQALVTLLQRQQRFDEARALLREGVSLAPTQAALLLPYARLLAARGEWSAAHEVLAPAADALANDAEYRGLCGVVLQRLGRFSQSVADYRAAVKLAPMASAWWVGLGLSLEGEGRSGEARGAYLQARATPLGPELAHFVEGKLSRPATD